MNYDKWTPPKLKWMQFLPIEIVLMKSIQENEQPYFEKETTLTSPLSIAC